MKMERARDLKRGSRRGRERVDLTGFPPSFVDRSNLREVAELGSLEALKVVRMIIRKRDRGRERGRTMTFCA